MRSHVAPRLFLRLPPNIHEGGRQGQYQFHHALRHVLLRQNAGGTKERWVHLLSPHQDGAREPSRPEHFHVCGQHRRRQQKQRGSSGRPRKDIREHAGCTTSPKPREVRLRSLPGEDTGLPGVAPRGRGQPDQDPGYHQHDASAVSQRRPTSDRQIGRPQQIHFQVRRAKPTFPQDAMRRKRLCMGTRASGSLRITQAAPIRVGNPYKPRPLATTVALHRSFATRS
jgi:hypothetical protein